MRRPFGAGALCVVACVLGTLGCGSDAVGRGDVPVYEWDPTWPQPLPDRWVVGPVVGVSVDGRDHIWVVHRPRGAVAGWQADCCVPAPAVIEFDRDGSVVQAWGGPVGPPADDDWVQSEHNIFVDHQDNVWLGNYSGSHILKMSRDGRLLLQIGRAHAQGQDSNDTDALASPTGITVDPTTSEVYVADGYGNRRVIVFDADTGAYKRHWGAYGNRPDDTVPFSYTGAGPPSQQFNTAHCVQIDQDDLVWVCDRANFRIQVFEKDGTFVKEVVIAPPPEGTTPVTISLNDGKGGMRPTHIGSVFDLAFSRDADQQFVFVADGVSEKVWILRRSDLEIIGSIGHAGHWGGGFSMVHNLGVDADNNLYISESAGGHRIQRFLYRGMGGASAEDPARTSP